MMINPKYFVLGIASLGGLLLMSGPHAAGEPLYYFSEAIGGRVVDALSNKPLVGAVASISWQLRPLKGEADGKDQSPRRLFVQQVRTDQDGKYAFPAWDKPRTRPHGWQLTPGFDPAISVYSSGYRRLALDNKPPAKPGPEGYAPVPPGGMRLSVWQGKTIKLTKLPDAQESLIKELTAWKADIEAEYAAYERQVGAIPARDSQAPLLAIWKESCKKLAEAQQRVACALPDLKANSQAVRPAVKEQEPTKTIVLEPSLQLGPITKPAQ